jgi:Family of unknown function (DUF6789)
LGSTLAGVKAGVIAGIVFVAAVALVNVVLLYVFKSDAMSLIGNAYPTQCPLAPTNSTVSAEACFTSVIQVDIPIYAFQSFLISLFIAGIFGRLYETLPGSSANTKGITVASIMAVTYILLGLPGVSFEYSDTVILNVAFIVLTMLYGLGLGRLYKRYTRAVEFATDDPDVRVLVDRKDLTGKSRTFAKKSTHELSVKGESGFREWVVSGGVTVEDPHSYETTMEVEGDGLLKASTKKSRAQAGSELKPAT